MPKESSLPRQLTPLRGSLPEQLSHSAARSLGAWGKATRELVALGFVPPDVLVGLTLYLLAGQPRVPRSDGEPRKGAVSGGVWVRERVTIHRPVRIGQELVVSGESARRFSLRGRRYGVTSSQARDVDGHLLVSSCTTGLLRYRKEEGLADRAEGRDESALGVPGPDDGSARDNPSRDVLRRLREGQRIEGDASIVTLEMMRVRDAGRDDNPIHTDPEVARREGLRAPIAGGSHVLAFLNEALLRAFGHESLLYGACFDVRWKGQTFAGTHVTPAARVERVTPDEVELALEVQGEERTALVGSLRIPLVGSGA